MLKFARYLVLGLLFGAAIAPQTLAQRHPMPGSKTEPAVLCTGCPGTNASGQNNDGLPTYPYSGVLVDHVGRYLDSSNTGSFQNLGYRTARARYIRPAYSRRGSAPPRLYIQIGNGIAAYSLDNFFTTSLPGGMVSISSFMPGIMGFPRTPPESVLKWEQLIYPEGPPARQEWQPTGQDIQDPMGKGSPIDFDDRGYVYSAHTIHGWGIDLDAGKTDASYMQKAMQFIAGPKTGYKNVKADTSGVSPESVIAIKSANKYYAIVADRTGTWAIYDVTDIPNSRMLSKSPSFHPQYGIRKAERDEVNKRVAYIDGGHDLHIYDYAAIVDGGTPVAEYLDSTGFVEIAFDESSNLWAVEKNGKVWKFTKSGNGYTPTVYEPFTSRFEPLIMHVGSGYMAIGGIDYAASTYDVRLFRIESTGLKSLDIDSYFKRYYHQAPAGYATPPAYTSIQAQSADVKIVKWGGETYLMYSGFGIGDVFKLEAGNAINISVRSNDFGTPNPKSAATESGPFYGDIVKFVASTGSAAAAYDVQWVFGNPEVGTANSGRSRTGEDEPHQYGGLTTAAQITSPKLVRAQTVQDPNINAQHNLSLKLPQPRVGANNLAGAIAANVNGLELVAGDRFHDASDGSVESHYNVWTLDGTATKANPLGTVAAGAIGPHTLQFQAVYGPYDASFTNATPYNAPALTVGYTVKPFKVTLETPTANGTNVTFRATPRVTTESGIITATQWTVNWTLNGNPYPAAAAGGVGSNAAQLAPVGTIPPVDIPKALLTDGAVVAVTVTIDPSGLASGAQQYNSGSASMTLSAPDPLIEVTGCANANSPCKFTAKSVGSKSQTGWTYLWTLTRPGGLTPLTSTAAVFEPSISAAGNYTITLKTTKTVFEATVDKQLSVAGSLCGSLPQAHTVGLTASCTSNCPAGVAIEFSASFLGYARQACDTYHWNFGDGATATTETASHAFNGQGTYTVTLTISNPSSANIVKTRNISIGGGTTDPGTPTCTKPTVASFTYSGTPSGCSTGGNCRTTDTISFSARRGTQGLQTCDSVTWDFGDGSTSTSRTPTKSFPSAGTYPVKLTVTNSNGAAESTQNVTIVTPPTGNCNTAPQPGNFVVTYVGGQSNCSESNGAGCQAGEAVRFEAINYFYVVGSCDNFEWDFGDGTKSTARTPSHVFSGNQTTYAVKLKVSNGAGTYTYSRNVPFANSTPTKPVPTISYSVFPTAGRKGQAVTFTATSSMATTTGWTWNFGDGTAANTSQAGVTSQSSTITYTFTKTGTFTVRASARNSEDAATAPTNTAQAQIVVTEAPAIPEYKFLLPVTAYTAGQGGSAWRTDVQIYNSDPQVSQTKPLVMEALFKGTTYQMQMIKATHIYENFLGNLLALQREDAGPVIITTKSATTPPQIWTRTYTQTSHGTFGQFIPAIRIDNMGGGAAAGDGKYYLSGLRHDNRYRTNVGFLNPNAAAITATVTVYDERRLKIGEFPLTLQPFALDQFTLSSKVQNLPSDKPFSLKIEVPAGNWLVAYASFIDGFSNDPVFMQALPESDVTSADYKTNVIPGVGHTGQWRSDVTILNPDLDAVQFDLQYYNSAGEKKGEALGVVLDGGKFLQYGDILKQGVLGNVEDGLGTLKLLVKSTHEKYPMTFARTYFDNGADGTYGQGIAGFAAARANVKPNKPAVIAGVRNTDLYYTNIGLVNVSNAVVTAKVTLLDPNTGAAVTSIDYTINPNQTILGRFNGFGAITQGTLKIEANGNLWGFASIIDVQTKDPEYVPAISMQ